ncbi:hypothetical protein, partial [Sinorhizobium fredii]|uniref:hypothetical protein n=1 Tax=Rhizobium fredii TaxID=380 RepID=UPI001AEC4704
SDGLQRTADPDPGLRFGPCLVAADGIGRNEEKCGRFSARMPRLKPRRIQTFTRRHYPKPLRTFGRHALDLLSTGAAAIVAEVPLSRRKVLV